MSFDHQYFHGHGHPPPNIPFVLNAENGTFVPATNYMDPNKQLRAPPGYSFVQANVLPASNSRNAMQYLDSQQNVNSFSRRNSFSEEYIDRHRRRSENYRKRSHGCPRNRQNIQHQHHQQRQSKYVCKSTQNDRSFENWSSSNILDLKENETKMQIAEIDQPNLVSSKALRFIGLEKHEKEFLKGKLVQNVYLCLQNLFKQSKCLVGEVEGKGYVTKFKIYKFKDLHYAQSVFELIVEHIEVKELSMKVDMKKGRFYRYGIEFQIVVHGDEVDALTEILQLLNLRPIFVKGAAFKEESEVESSLKCIGPLEKTRSRPQLFDCEGLEPMTSTNGSSKRSSTGDQVLHYKEQHVNFAEEKETFSSSLGKSFSCLSIDVGGQAMHLDIEIGHQDTAQVSKESLSRLRRSVSKALSDSAFQKSLSMDDLTLKIGNIDSKSKSLSKGSLLSNGSSKSRIALLSSSSSSKHLYSGSPKSEISPSKQVHSSGSSKSATSPIKHVRSGSSSKSAKTESPN